MKSERGSCRSVLSDARPPPNEGQDGDTKGQSEGEEASAPHFIAGCAPLCDVASPLCAVWCRAQPSLIVGDQKHTKRCDDERRFVPAADLGFIGGLNPRGETETLVCDGGGPACLFDVRRGPSPGKHLHVPAAPPDWTTKGKNATSRLTVPQCAFCQDYGNLVEPFQGATHKFPPPPPPHHFKAQIKTGV